MQGADMDLVRFVGLFMAWRDRHEAQARFKAAARFGPAPALRSGSRGCSGTAPAGRSCAGRRAAALSLGRCGRLERRRLQCNPDQASGPCGARHPAAAEEAGSAMSGGLLSCYAMNFSF